MLAFENVTKTFDGHTAIEAVSLELDAGEHCAVVGPSGAGKTTLLRLASGAITPESGEITLSGKPVAGERIAHAYQGETLVGRRSALSNVLVGRLDGLPWWRGFTEPLWPIDPEPAHTLLEELGLEGKANQRADALSAGERQRVAFARALIQDAPVLLADEPTRSLDPSTRETVLSLLAESVADRLLVSVLHDVDLALKHADRIIALADGRIQFDRAADVVSDVSDLYDSESTSRTENKPQQAQSHPVPPRYV